eukprot:c3761_g1_i1.p1 GENE.c3761_g1_i1~~c3761_g1_i1.p1  ORF type:complete len:795 (-),score=167.69 c3761_g1_i1:43-2385(-)
MGKARQYSKLALSKGSEGKQEAEGEFDQTIKDIESESPQPLQHEHTNSSDTFSVATCVVLLLIFGAILMNTEDVFVLRSDWTIEFGKCVISVLCLGLHIAMCGATVTVSAFFSSITFLERVGWIALPFAYTIVYWLWSLQSHPFEFLSSLPLIVAIFDWALFGTEYSFSKLLCLIILAFGMAGLFPPTENSNAATEKQPFSLISLAFTALVLVFHTKLCSFSIFSFVPNVWLFGLNSLLLYFISSSLVVEHSPITASTFLEIFSRSITGVVVVVLIRIFGATQMCIVHTCAVALAVLLAVGISRPTVVGCVIVYASAVLFPEQVSPFLPFSCNLPRTFLNYSGAIKKTTAAIASISLLVLISTLDVPDPTSSSNLSQVSATVSIIPSPANITTSVAVASVTSVTSVTVTSVTSVSSSLSVFPSPNSKCSINQVPVIEHGRFENCETGNSVESGFACSLRCENGYSAVGQPPHCGESWNSGNSTCLPFLAYFRSDCPVPPPWQGTQDCSPASLPSMIPEGVSFPTIDSQIPRTAVCVSGEMDFLPRTIESFENKLLPEIAVNFGAATDVFFYLHHSGSQSDVDFISNLRNKAYTRMIFEESSTCSPHILEQMHQKCHDFGLYRRISGGDVSRAVLTTFYRISRCHDMVLEYSRITGAAYATEFRVRTDLSFFGDFRIPEWRNHPNAIYTKIGSNFFRSNDQIAFGPAALMDIDGRIFYNLPNVFRDSEAEELLHNSDNCLQWVTPVTHTTIKPDMHVMILYNTMVRDVIVRYVLVAADVQH